MILAKYTRDQQPRIDTSLKGAEYCLHGAIAPTASAIFRLIAFYFTSFQIKLLSKVMKTITCLSLTLCSSLFADITMPSFFSDGMVLQQKTGATLWGSTSPNSKVSVEFEGNSYPTTADASGAWKLNLKDLQASKEGSTLSITSDGSTKTIKDVLVGEVWLASGQSNMEWPMQRSDSKDYAKQVNNSLIRQYHANNVAIGSPQGNFNGKWVSANSNSTSKFSAVAFHFAEQLQQELDVPVGIIEAAWGGKPIQAFISEGALQQLPEGKACIQAKQEAQQQYANKAGENPSKQDLANFKELHQKWVKGGKKGPAPKKPKKPANPGRNPILHSNIYNGMIHPLIGYGMRGAIWYQGENNTKDWTSVHYKELLECMVKDWRSSWNQPFSFYWVQLASFKPASQEAGAESPWAMVQDEMRRALATIPQSGMAVITDIGNANDIHPLNKKDVGHRLAKWALHFDYGKKDILYSGPLYKTATFTDDQAIVSFDHATGLKSTDGEALRMFELAGEDGKWAWADAKIENDTIVVTSTQVKSPKKVRFAWHANALKANLTNSSTLPASCFSSETK